MFEFNVTNFQWVLASCFLVMGVITFSIGVAVLIFRGAGNEVRGIATQTAKLAQKGLAEDVAGLVGNASALLDSLNQLARTATGVGVFLVIVGLLLLAAAYGVVYRVG